MMERNQLIDALRRMQVETGSLVCLGCGQEHNCGVHGCAIIREAVEALSEAPKWISLADQHPEPGVWVLACCGPIVCEAYTDINGYFHRVPQEHWPGEDSPYPVTHWMPLPSRADASKGVGAEEVGRDAQPASASATQAIRASCWRWISIWAIRS